MSISLLTDTTLITEKTTPLNLKINPRNKNNHIIKSTWKEVEGSTIKEPNKDRKDGKETRDQLPYYKVKR